MYGKIQIEQESICETRVGPNRGIIPKGTLRPFTGHRN